MGMDEMMLATIALPLAAGSLVAALAAWLRLEVRPALAKRAELRSLRAELGHLADEHASRPRRHNVHCPACGRFARLVYEGQRGRMTRCAAHGIVSSPARLVGWPERHLVAVTTHRPLVDVALAPVASPLHVAPPRRERDWLDGPAPLPPRLVAVA